jgi:uncharacterized damage-inducible protein DinB
MDLRYPVGPFKRPAEWSSADRAAAIVVLAELPQKMAAAVAGLTDAQLNTPYRPDGWTVRQVVHHVADSHMNAYIRMRLAATQDNPTISPYDQDRWAALADSRRMNVNVSLMLVEALHARWVVFLRDLTPAEFARPFVHPESGPQTIDTAVALYAWHSRHHTAHITSLRERNGWK